MGRLLLVYESRDVKYFLQSNMPLRWRYHSELGRLPFDKVRI